MKPYNVLFLCTHNSARSILAEGYLNARAEGRFVAYSAGSHPAGGVNPFALELLQSEGIATSRLWSKSWDEFAKPGAPEINFVLTVCDNAAEELCPIWPGRPITAHWGIDDPGEVPGGDEAKRKAFRRVYCVLSARIDRLLALPIDGLDEPAIKARLQDIAKVVNGEQSR